MRQPYPSVWFMKEKDLDKDGWKEESVGVTWVFEKNDTWFFVFARNN